MWVCFLQNREVMLKTRILAASCMAVLLLAAESAWAQFAVSFWEREYNDDERKELADGFNLEECEADMTMTFEYTYSGSLGDGDLYVYIGSGCDEKTNRDEGRCHAVIENQPLQTSAYIEIHPAPVVEPTEDIPACTQSEGASDVYFLVLDDDSAQTVLYEYYATINYDTLPPDPPEDITGSYGERMIRVSWEVSEPDFPEEWAGFHVVCYGGDHLPDVVEPVNDAYTDTVMDTVSDTGIDLADVPSDVADDWDATDVPDAGDMTDPDTTTFPDASVADTGAGDGAAADGCPSGGFEEGDEWSSAYSCSGELGSTTRSYELTGLQNNVPYKVSVVAVDSFGNESAIGEVACATPDEVDDFWEVYRKDGGGDDGGFCFVATAAFGDYDHPAVVWLRALRDEVVEDLPGGRALVQGYYEASPPLARWLRARPAARNVARAALWPAAGAAYVTVQARRHPGLAACLVLGLIVCCAGLRVSGVGPRRKG